METIDTAIFSRLLYLIAPPAFRCEIAPTLLSAEKGVAVLRFLIVLTVISTEPILFPQSAVAATWNYCEPLGRYYPYTPTCPVPWKEVQPNNAPNGGMPLPPHRPSAPMVLPSAQPQTSVAHARARQPNAEAEASSLPPGPPLAIPVTKVNETYTSPHAYCRAIGTIDQPDQRYIGPKQPKSFWHEFDLDEGHGMLEWRCMDGAVYACGSGNDPVCGKMSPYERINDIKQFCQENPNADIVPIAIMGHFPVNWACEGGQPVIKQGDFRVDKRGYPVVYWKLIWQRESDTMNDASTPPQPPSATQQTDADKNAEKMPCYNSWVAHAINHQFPYNSATTWQDTLDMLIKTKNTYKSNSDQLDTFIEIDKNRISHLEEILSTPYSEMKRRFDSLPVLPDDDFHDRAQQDGLDIVSENWCTLKIEVPYIKEDLERLTKLQAAQR